MDETQIVYTPILRKFEISDNSDDAMTEEEWRHESPYMTPMKKGKKRNKGKGVKRLVTPERPILNMPQTPSRTKLEFDWAKPAASLAHEDEPADLGKFIHQQKTFPSGRNGSVRVDVLRQSRQRHPGGRLLRAQSQYHASRCTSPSDRSFAVSSSDSARAFSDAPESTCSYGGAFRTLRDLTIRIVKFWSS